MNELNKINIVYLYLYKLYFASIVHKTNTLI